MAHTCPNCDTELSPSNTTINDGNSEFSTYDTFYFFANDKEVMKNVIVNCDNCGWSVARSMTGKTP